jgi:hypothetical protein
VVVPEANNAQSRMASLRLKYEILVKSKEDIHCVRKLSFFLPVRKKKERSLLLVAKCEMSSEK